MHPSSSDAGDVALGDALAAFVAEGGSASDGGIAELDAIVIDAVVVGAASTDAVGAGFGVRQLATSATTASARIRIFTSLERLSRALPTPRKKWELPA